MTDKKVIITEVAPHIYTYTYKLKRYGERVKIIFEIDGVYFQGADNGAYVMEREDFTEACAKAYERARENVADGAAKGMRYFVEVQKRIDAATPPETTQTADADAATTLPNEDINYMFYIKPKGAKRFSTYNPGKGTMNTGRVFTELYRKEHLPAVCKWIAEDLSGDFAYQLRSGDGKRIYWQHNPTAATATETAQIPTETAELSIAPICELYNNPDIEPELDAGLYFEWLKRAEKGSYETIAEKAMTEARINIFLAAYKRGKGHVLAINERGELIDTVFALNDAPQSPENPQTVKHTTSIAKLRETARNQPKRTISKKERVRTRQKLGVQYCFMLADASATLAAIKTPPIRGDCLIIGRWR